LLAEEYVSKSSKSAVKAGCLKDAVMRVEMDMCKPQCLVLEWQAWKQENIEVSIVNHDMLSLNSTQQVCLSVYLGMCTSIQPNQAA